MAHITYYTYIIHITCFLLNLDMANLKAMANTHSARNPSKAITYTRKRSYVNPPPLLQMTQHKKDIRKGLPPPNNNMCVF